MKSTKAQAITVCVVEDDAPLREYLAGIINGTDGFCCLGHFPSARLALEGIPALKPDVVLMDLVLGREDGIECIRQLRPLLPSAQIIALTVLSTPEKVFKALEAGATGYLAKRQPPAKIIEAIQDVHQGGSPMSSSIARLIVQSFRERGQARRDQETLSTREQEILGLVAKGARNKQIAEQLNIALDTVRTHLRRIYKKLHVSSRTAAAMAMRGK